MDWVEADGEAIILRLRVVPRAARDGVQGVLGDALKIRLQSPAVEGRANESLRAFLAGRLGVAPRQVELLAGLTGRQKRVRVAGVSVPQARARLLPPGPKT